MSSILTYTDSENCGERKEHDFYPTPWDATEAALNAEAEWLAQYDEVDEPACGEGHMAEMLKGRGKTVYASDLVDRGYGECGIDFLSFNFKRRSRCLFTNPPFQDEDKNSLAEPFIRHAHYLGYEYIGMILKVNYFNTKGRIPLFTKYRPVRVYPYSWRIDFTGGGNNHFDCNFVVWMPQHQGKTEYCIPLERPKFSGQIKLF